MHTPRRSALLTLLLLHAGMLAYEAWVHGPGVDEIGHLPAGLCIWHYGDFGLYRVNPPLVRTVATFPLSFLDLELQHVRVGETRSRPEFPIGATFWNHYGWDAYGYLTVARIAAIPFSLVAGILIFQWSRALYGGNAGLVSLALWCFSPLVLTNASMITPDVGACAMGTWACYSFYRWLRDRTWDRAWFCGVLLGLAELTKFTWIILFPLFMILLFGHEALRRRFDSRALVQFAILLLIAILVINVGYGFAGSWTRLGDFEFVSETLRGCCEPDSDNRFANHWLGNLPVPLPAEYLLGIDRQKLDFERGFDSYLRGTWRNRGWWYYYLYGLAIKTPIGYLGIAMLSLASLLWLRPRWSEGFLLAPAVLILLLVSSQTGFNHHLRYVLPALPFLHIWAGRLWSSAVHTNCKWAATACLAGGIAASGYVFPHSHAYFNWFAGGPRQGHHHLLDSNIDWGQDILYLAQWQQENPTSTLDGLAFHHNFVPLKKLDLPTAMPPTGETGPQPGWWAVSVQRLHDREQQYDYFLFFHPAEVLGYTVYIYHLSPADIEKYRTAHAGG